MVTGTAGPDRISIVPTKVPGTVRVVFNGKVLGSFGPVTAIEVHSAAGNDTVTVDPRITLPATLDGGAGNDRLQAGFAPTVLRGSAGNDELVGVRGRDVFDAGSGRDRQVFLRHQGVIQVGPSVSAAARRSLSTSYTLRPLQVAGPAIVGPADLRDEAIVDQLRANYDGGQPVALATATAEDATSLATLLGDAGQVRLPGDRPAELVAFRKADQGGRTVSSTFVLPPIVQVPVAPGNRKLGRAEAAQSVRAYLQGIFSAPPAVPARPKAGGPAQDLLAISTATMNTQLYYDVSGAAIQVTNTVYSVRSFTNSEDFYYFLQEVISKVGTAPFASVTAANEYVFGEDFIDSPTLLQPSPQSNPGTTTYTSSTSWSIGGSIGYNQAQGFNASISGGVSVTNSQVVQVPPIQIVNRSDPVYGAAWWDYVFNTATSSGNSYTFYDQWIWEVPFSDYVSLASPTTRVFTTVGYTDSSDVFHASQYDEPFPRPFGTTYALSSPTVSGVSDPSVKAGGTFTITGSAFYPSLVQSVLIGGQALSTDNFAVVNDHEIQVIAPATPGKALPVVVKTAQGFSNADVTITITAP
jgi:hypothetical protein